MELHKKYKTLLTRNGINTPLRVAHFMAQLEHESGLKPINENFNYSAKRLLEVFKYDFDTNRDRWLSDFEKGKVRWLIGHPERIANFVYANQNGNGNEASGDGWRFRGRGFIQTTGRANYARATKDTGIDFLNNPDLMLIEANAMVAALSFYKRINGNKFADKNDVRGLTRAINGGYNGLEHRTQLLKNWKNKLSFI